MNIKHFIFDKMLPIYIPKSARFSDRLHLAIWNCGTRPQTLFQAIKDVRITIRKNNEPIFVIKKGAV
jgi:hypothetical protein